MQTYTRSVITKAALHALVCWYASGAIVGLGLLLGIDNLRPGRGATRIEQSIADAATPGDGRWYLDIASNGYSYKPGERCNVAFFPLHPGLAGLVSRLSGADPATSLVVVSNTALLLCLLLFAVYGCTRTDTPNIEAVRFATLALVLFPPTFFWRMSYSESIFALSLCAFLLASKCSRGLFWTLAAAGLCTAARPTGIAVLLPVWWQIYRRSGGGVRALAIACGCMPLAAWGLLAYMAFLWVSFGDPLAFAHAQYEWSMRPLESPLIRLTRLVTLEPVWSVYSEHSPCYWRTLVPDIPAALSLQACNPLYFGIAVVTIGWGAKRRWLTTNELLLSVCLLAVPFATRGYEMCMASHGRFVSVVVPMYIVMGNALSKLPEPKRCPRPER